MTYVADSVVLHSQNFRELVKTATMKIEALVEPPLGLQDIAHPVQNFPSPGLVSDSLS